jgi:hypothetical protein
LDIFNPIGERVARLINENLSAGSHQVKWNAANLPSGVYIGSLKTDESVFNQKLILLK